MKLIITLKNLPAITGSILLIKRIFEELPAHDLVNYHEI